MPARHPSSPPPTSSRNGTTAGPPERTADAVAPAGRGAARPPCRERSPASGDTAVGRIPVLDVRPVVLGGRRPAKAVVGETFEVSATVFREGHDAVAAHVVLCDPEGRPGPWT
ncbi:maltotransferase domain-containing protein, partial [Streptomyces sp. NPDC004629]|uniref:maltotransferase domain-containing protein n=1 Tax=Streptomyces sp. NPDC004629 TaxID=3364705 RepID=UPI0036C2942C